MSTVDILLQSIGIERLTLGIVSREPILRMRNIETTITSSLESTEDSASRGSSSQSNIKKDLEGTSSIFNLLGDCMATIGFNNTLVLVGKANLGQSTTGNEEASSIGSSPILEAMLNSVSRQFRRVCRRKDIITL
jgi:hypothetical protein